eukprot:bmy_20448T0
MVTAASIPLLQIMKHLTMAELPDLIWTAVDSLGSTSPSRGQAAADTLLTVIQEHRAKLETVANLGRAIHLQLSSVRIPQGKENALQAITLLARNRTPELVAAFLDFSIPLDRCPAHLPSLPHCPPSILPQPCLPSVEGPGGRAAVSCLVLAELLAWVLERPLPTRTSDGSPRPTEKAYLRSMAGLLPAARHWQDFAHLELQGAWDLFAATHTDPQGVGLLASGEPVVVRVMGTVSDVLHRLGAHSTGAQSLGIAINARSFSDDMSHSQEGLSIHLAQALSYLHSHRRHIKTWAALFMGYTICHHPQAVSQMVKDMDTKLLFCTFEDLKNDPEPGIQELATRQSSFLQQMAARPR